jgi:hypothetical protein
MNKFLLILGFSLITACPVLAGSLTVLGGYVTPSGSSDIFTQNEQETTFRTKDLNDFGISIGYDHFLNNYINIGGGVTYYRGRTRVRDVVFVFDDGSSVIRDITLEIVPLEFGLKVLPLGREKPVIPYFGGGGGAYYWKYEEAGDFVFNRNTNNPTPVTGRAFSDGTDFGYHLEGGVYIPVGRSLAVTGEVKYWNANGNLDRRGFDPAFEPIDLSATMFSGGVSFWF